jgi:hypothetical protein
MLIHRVVSRQYLPDLRDLHPRTGSTLKSWHVLCYLRSWNPLVSDRM